MSAFTIDDSPVRHYCAFGLGHRRYGIDLEEVREVSTPLAITAVAHTPPAVRGLANLRSRIYLVLDLRPLMGLASIESTPESRLIILRPGIAENVAILVDRGGDIVTVAQRSIEEPLQPAPAAQGVGMAGPQLVTGICKLDNELLTVVGSTRLVDHVRSLLAQGATAGRTANQPLL